MKTMQELENQAYRMSERNWYKKNGWPTAGKSRAAKINRDLLIERAFMYAAAKHLTEKAKRINNNLTVWPLRDMSALVVDFSNKSVGFTLMIADAFIIEAFLNDSQEVNARINA